MRFVNFKNYKNLIRFASLLLILAIFAPVALEAQKLVPTNSMQQEGIIISVNNIAIRGELSLRGLTANFPWPILSTISVVDTVGNLVTGLADTVRWLATTDQAENGQVISQIWHPVLEYHEANPSFPADPDIYNQTPKPLFTEVRKTELLPTSTMLVMDVSGSMLEEIEDAKDGIKTYIRLFRVGVDRGGIIEFAQTVSMIQPMTADTTTLMNTIDQTVLGGRTAVYDALMRAVILTKTELSRRAIIIYTDGADNSSRTTGEAVIDSARFYNLPIYTIALGDETEEDTLKHIAEETGGLFFKAATSEEMKQILIKLSAIVQNYYVMAHASPDPFFNRTWRLVDVTAQVNEKQGRGKGRYYVPGPPAIRNTDLALSFSSITDTTIVVDGDTLNATLPGADFRYTITVRNLGANLADTVNIVHMLPDFVDPLAASITPKIFSGDSLTWELFNLRPGVSANITVSVRLADPVPAEVTELVSQARIWARNDTSPANNYAIDSVRVLFPIVQPAYDLSLTQSANTDTTTDLAGALVPAVVLGNSYRYSLIIRNQGDTAQDFTVWNRVPDSVRVSDFNIPPSSQNADTLFWQSLTLASADSLLINFAAAVAPSVPETPFALVNNAGIIAAYDTLLDNNFTSTTVYAIPRQKPPRYFTDVGLDFKSVTDTTIIVGLDTLNAVRPGESYVYNLRLKNTGPNGADSLKLVQLLPDSVRYLGASIVPRRIHADSLIWYWDHLPAGAELAIQMNVRLADQLPLSFPDRISTVFLEAANDTSLANNFAADTVRILFPAPPPRYDLALDFTSATDTSITVGQKTFNAVMPGKAFSYDIVVRNLGPDAADSATVVQTLPDSVAFLSASMAPASASADSLAWRLSKLGVGAEAKIAVMVRLATAVPTTLQELLSRVRVHSQGDTSLANNFAADTVRVLFPAPLPRYDLALDFTSVTDTSITVGQKTFNAVMPGKAFSYDIVVRNLGPDAADSATVVQTLPDSVAFLSASMAPASASADSLAWRLSKLGVGAEAKIAVDVRLATAVPITLQELLSRVQVRSQGDTSLANNSAADTVRVLFPVPPPRYDLALDFTSVTDSVVIIEQKPYNAVKPGQEFGYELVIRNLGPDAADSATVVQTLPDSVIYLNASSIPHSSAQNALVWRLEKIPSSAMTKITVSVRLPDQIDTTITELKSQVRIIAVADTHPDNNFAADTVQVIPSKVPEPRKVNCNLAIAQSVVTDTTIQIARKSIPAAFAGESYRYRIDLVNLGPGTARDVTVWNNNPDSVMMTGVSLPPAEANRESLFWKFDSLKVGETVQIWLDAKVSESLQFLPFLLFNRCGLRAENDTLDQDNDASSQVYAIKPGQLVGPGTTNLNVQQFVRTDSLEIVGNDTLRFVKVGETYDYLLQVSNRSSVAALNVRLINYLPDSVIIGDFQDVPEIISADSLLWSLGILLPASSYQLKLAATVVSQMPIGMNQLVNIVTARADNELPTALADNKATSTIFNPVRPITDWQPLIEASPQKVKLGNNVQVRVQVLYPIASWDLWVYLANGQIDETYGDKFIAENLLNPNRWYEISPQYAATQMEGNKDQEPLEFELRVWDVFGDFKSARTAITVEREEELVVDKNVYNPDRDGTLGIRFKLAGSRVARLDIYDITGTKITGITESAFSSGWNTFQWDGLTENGQKIGSGFYILTIQSGAFYAWKKLMIIQ